MVKQRGDELDPWSFRLETSGSVDDDDRYFISKMREHEKGLDSLRADGVFSADGVDTEALEEVDIEQLFYPSPWPYARAALVNLSGASSELAPFVRFVALAEAPVKLEDAAQWAIKEDLVSAQGDGDTILKRAKKWVKNRVNEARKEGWLLPASEETRGLYEPSPRALHHYGKPVEESEGISAAALSQAREAREIDGEEAP